MLMCIDYIQNWLHVSHGLLIKFKHSVSEHFLDNATEKCLEILHADVSWLLQNWLDLCDALLILVGSFLTSWNWSNLKFPGISLRNMGNDLKLGMKMYADHRQISIDKCHGNLIFLTLAQFWPSETGQIYGFLTFYYTSYIYMIYIYISDAHRWVLSSCN